ncbi:hypothetical protein [Priestia aryabhattai]|uniref:hypothetical protein n=1 Tax=Priestia aryabhattai TaxID=412384 RepID=UPI0008DDF937|nr:hypothetical protein [Priestia aryabhattai]OHY73461.1 hypothetical protein BCV52_26650 [Priestia aryabhattai]
MSKRIQSDLLLLSLLLSSKNRKTTSKSEQNEFGDWKELSNFKDHKDEKEHSKHSKDDKHHRHEDKKHHCHEWNDHKGGDDFMGHEDCGCKKKFKCDCCCTTGIREELERLRGRTVEVAFGPFVLVGVVSDVDCDILSLAVVSGGTSIPTKISLCEISYVAGLTP